MRLLFIGDIVGKSGCEYVCNVLNDVTKYEQIDFVIANGENIGDRNGLSAEDAKALRFAGVDVITTGNHAFGDLSVFGDSFDGDYVLRPYNYPKESKGSGYTVVKTPFGRIAVVSMQGQVNMIPADNPFDSIDRLLEKLNDCDMIFVDFHAEATSEKKAFGFYLDGKVSAVIGTHTHVQTADATFLPKGTAYITDVGMTGGRNSVIGIKKESAIERFKTGLHTRFIQEKEDIEMDALVIDTDNKSIYAIKR